MIIKNKNGRRYILICKNGEWAILETINTVSYKPKEFIVVYNLQNSDDGSYFWSKGNYCRTLSEAEQIFNKNIEIA